MAPLTVLQVVFFSAAASAHALARGIGTRTVGIDFGLKRVGVALSSGFSPIPLTVVSCNGSKEDFPQVASQICRIALGEGASQIVLGLPLNSSGGEGEQAVVTREFASSLACASQLPVFLWDERFSSAEASMRMNSGRGASAGQTIDAVAAAIILEEFFAGEWATAESICAPGRPAEERAPTTSTHQPPPSSYSDIRRQMQERAVEQQRTALQRPGKGGSTRAGRRAKRR
jgi:putative holliday junction resolvase